MEALSAAASVVQLSDSIKKLYDSWESIKEAPDDIRTIATDLKLVSCVLAAIASEAQHEAVEATFEEVLETCASKVLELVSIVNKIEPSFASKSNVKRRWAGRLKAVVKNTKISKFQQSLESLKSTLLLVQQLQERRLNRLSHHQTLVTVANKISPLSVQQLSFWDIDPVPLSSPTTTNDHEHLSCQRTDKVSVHAAPAAPGEPVYQVNVKDFYAADWPNSRRSLKAVDGSWSPLTPQRWIKRRIEEQSYTPIESFFGSIRVKSRTFLLESNDVRDHTIRLYQDRHESRTSYTISPATWLANIGLRYGFQVDFIHSSLRGWQHTLKTFCPVPDDAPIFEFCSTGNLPAVRTLLSNGHASVTDTNSGGRTPLHYAAEARNPELCKFLINAGADIFASTHSSLKIYCENSRPKRTALLSASDHFVTSDRLSDTIETLRLLEDCMDFSEPLSDGWDILGLYLVYFQRQCWKPDVDQDATRMMLHWMLRQWSFDIKANFAEVSYVTCLQFMGFERLQDVASLFLRLGPNNRAIDVAVGPHGYSALMRKVALGYCSGDPLSFGPIITFGPNLHLIGLDLICSPIRESPTSLAIYSSFAFSGWQGSLKSSEVDIGDFIDREMEQSPLKERGWNHDSLRRLFDWDFKPSLKPQGFWSQLLWQRDNRCYYCHQNFMNTILVVQPRWQYLLHLIKQGKHPNTFPADCLEVYQDWDSEINEAFEVDVSLEMTAIDVVKDAVEARDSPTSDGRSFNSAISQKGSEVAEGSANTPICSYDKNLLCVDCWLRYQRNGYRWPKSDTGNSSVVHELSSEEEYSPFFVHT